MRKIESNLKREFESYLRAGYPREKAIEAIQSRRGSSLFTRTVKDASHWAMQP